MLRAAFSLFQLEAKALKDTCDERELPTLVRACGYNPSQARAARPPRPPPPWPPAPCRR